MRICSRETKMVEIPTCGGPECGACSIEAGGASKMQPSFPISHFSFLISHFSFFIFHFRYPAGQRLPADTTAMIGESWQPCLSTDRRAPTSRTSPSSCIYALSVCQIVGPYIVSCRGRPRHLKPLPCACNPPQGKGFFLFCTMQSC